MTLNSLYPVLSTTDVSATAAFYRTHFGFESTFESQWYVALQLGSHELGILDRAHDSIPEAYRNRVASGVLVTLEVDDVDELHDRLVEAGVPLVQPLRSEEFGQRHAIFVGPDDLLIDVITPIPPSDRFAEQFSASALAQAREGSA